MCDTIPTFDYRAAETAILPWRKDVYGEAGGFSLPMHIYAPTVPNENASTAVLCIHGGSWVSALKKDVVWQGDWMRHHARFLSTLGFYAFEITYRSIGRDDEPPTGFDLADIVADVKCAMAYLKETLAPALGLTRFAVMGDSAGAHLALCLALAEEEALRPDVVVACNPVSDCVTLNRWQGRLKTREEQMRVSPLHLACKTKTKILIQHGTADAVVSPADSDALFAALKAQGCDVTLTPVAGANHAFILYGFNGNEDEIHRCMTEAVRFIKSR